MIEDLRNRLHALVEATNRLDFAASEKRFDALDTLFWDLRAEFGRRLEAVVAAVEVLAGAPAERPCDCVPNLLSKTLEHCLVVLHNGRKELDQAHAGLAVGAARHLFQSGRHERAREWVELALRLDAHIPQLTEMLEEFE